MKTIKNFSLYFIFVFLTISSYGQLKVNSSGRVDIDGQSGSFSSEAPRISINSTGTTINSVCTSLNLFNTNTTLNNWTRLNFATKNSDGSEEDYVSLATQYKDRSTSYKGADFHIATLNRGYYASRFAIYNNSSDANDVKFFFNTGYTSGGRGIWFDDSGYGYPTIRPTTTNYGCLGTSTYYWRYLYANYAYYNTHTTITSDERKKKDIETVEGTLSQLKKVRSVKYKLKENEGLGIETTAKKISDDIYKGSDELSFSADLDAETIVQDEKEKKAKSEKVNYGFIAQELIKVFPEVVIYDSINDSYGIQYTALIPIIVESMQEQQSIIDAQSLKIKEMENKIEGSFTKHDKNVNLKSASASTDTDIMDATTNAFLFQNIPNPFTYDTEIKYYLPENANNAVLYVFNLQGNLIMTEKLSGTGNGSIIINGSQLNPGMYVYSLLINDQEMDSKRMILTE